MKKLFLSAMLFSMAAFTFAFKLPTGQETVVHDSKEVDGKVVAVILSSPVTFNTVIGDIEAKVGTRADFYESGALKSFYTDTHCDVTTAAGTFKITSFHSSRPENKVPLEFYESGALKQAYFSRQGKPFVSTPLGQLQAMQATKVTFFENGNIESFAVYPNQRIQLNGLTGCYQQQSELAFHENGFVKTLTSNSEEFHKRLGMKIKKGTEINFAESGKIISFTPADNATVKIGELMFLLCRGKTFELYESGNIKKCTIDCSKQDFSIGNTTFAYKTVTDSVESELPVVPTAYLTLELAENGQLLSAMADKVGAHGEAFPIVGGINERLWSAKSLEYFEDGKLHCIDYVRAIQIGKRLRPNILIGRPQGYANVDVSVVPAVKITKKNTTYEIWKSYFSNDGSTEYLVGREVTESPKSNFYDETANGIFVLKNGQITESIYIEDITGTSNLIFDADEKLTAYTIKSEDSEDVLTKQIKK